MYSHSILFPGQESQNTNMLLSLIKENTIIKKTFDESSEYIKYDLNALIKRNSQKEINKNKFKLLITFTLSIAMYRLWNNNNNNKSIILAGHSLGEYSALVCSQSLTFHDAVKLIILRKKFMKESMNNNQGAMHAIIGLTKSKIEKILKDFEHTQSVSIACINTKYQIVISGEFSVVHQVSAICKKHGAKKIFFLPISPPSHCILMKQASKKLSIILNEIKFKTPMFPVINNVDARCETSISAIRKALAKQLCSPVQWVNTITYLISNYTLKFIEAGLNNTLTNLNKSIIKIL
ncbi:MAG: ACP S-malonyltransferase [Buchnera aphidicola (Kaburagia rhusicola ensigallis)]